MLYLLKHSLYPDRRNGIFSPPRPNLNNQSQPRSLNATQSLFMNCDQTAEIDSADQVWIKNYVTVFLASDVVISTYFSVTLP